MNCYKDALLRDQRHISTMSSKLKMLEMTEIAKEIITEALQKGDYPVIAFSGGKGCIMRVM
ncbi:hypothetical protein V7O67_05255 [Methanolobus sp. ZRKC4]|uniref:hypothetical protein n=1 Tax=Methanolobus sp. ZRKC4 TaxID=3125787 RepID=UPI00324C785B